MIVKSLIVLMLLMPSFFCFSQNEVEHTEKRAMNAVTIGFMGEGNLLSLNYSRKILVRRKFFVDAKLGIGILYSEIPIFGDEAATVWGLSHTISFNYGGKGHFLELGIGGNVYKADSKLQYIPFPTIGYKYQPTGHAKVQFTGRVFIHPRGTDSSHGVFVPVGIAAGISF